jgi:hypothetical protein
MPDISDKVNEDAFRIKSYGWGAFTSIGISSLIGYTHGRSGLPPTPTSIILMSLGVNIIPAFLGVKKDLDNGYTLADHGPALKAAGIIAGSSSAAYFSYMLAHGVGALSKQYY